MERQPHVRVPHEAFFDQPPRPGETGYDDLYTNTIDLELYKKQQKALEIFVDAEEKKLLLKKMTDCALKAGNMYNADRQCADLVEEYARRLPHAPQFGKPINTVVNLKVLQPDWDGYDAAVYTPPSKD